MWVSPLPDVIVVAGVVVVVGFDSHWGVERKVQPWTDSVLVPTRRCFGGYCYGWEAGQIDEKGSHLPINMGEGTYHPSLVPSFPSHRWAVLTLISIEVLFGNAKVRECLITPVSPIPPEWKLRYLVFRAELLNWFHRHGHWRRRIRDDRCLWA